MTYVVAYDIGTTGVKTCLFGIDRDIRMSATPISCCAGYHTICEIERTRAWETAAKMGDRLKDGLNVLIEKKGLPFVAYNVGSICHLDTVGTMRLAVSSFMIR